MIFSRRISYISINNTIYVIIAKHYTFLFLYYIKEKNHCIKTLDFQTLSYSVIEYSFYYINIVIKIIKNHKITNKNNIIILHYILKINIITTLSITFFCLLKHAYMHCVLYFTFINIRAFKIILKYDKHSEITLDVNIQFILYLFSLYQKVHVPISSRYNHFYIVIYLTLNSSIYIHNTYLVNQNKNIINSHGLKPTKDINYCLGIINGIIYITLFSCLGTGHITRIRVKYIICVWDLINLTKILYFIVLSKNEIFVILYNAKRMENHFVSLYYTNSFYFKTMNCDIFEKNKFFIILTSIITFHCCIMLSINTGIREKMYVTISSIHLNLILHYIEIFIIEIFQYVKSTKLRIRIIIYCNKFNYELNGAE